MQASALLLLPCQSFPPQFLSSSSPADCPRRLFSPGRPRLPISDARKLPGPPVAADAFASSSFACCVTGTSSGAGVGSSFGFPDEEDSEKWDSAKYEALLKGGDQVTSVLQEMVKLLADMELDQASEAAAVAIAAQGVIGKRVDEMEAGFMMALDYMIQLAEKDKDDERKSLLEVIKQTVMDHLTKKCPPHVQVIGLLCRTPEKDSRHELLRRVAAGGGVFKSEKGDKVHLPSANLNDIANQADDLLETMESRRNIPDRKLLARLVLIREEARGMMGGGILDERNDRGLSTLPEAEVLGGVYSGSVSGMTAQHLEWVHERTLQILQEIAF